MLAHLKSFVGEAALWRPLFPLAALALIQALAVPARLWAKALWTLAVLAAVVATAALVRQQTEATSAAAGATAAKEISTLQGLWTRLDALSQQLPPAGDPPAPSFAGIDDAAASLSAKAAAIEAQIAALKEKMKGRAIADDAAAKLADYLRQFGGYRVVVSCVPDDVEAYTYANQLVGILRMAGWDARGPEITAAGDAAAMGVSLFARDPRSADGAKILVDAFTRFNVPYQTGLAASDAIPDTATVELFVAKKP